MLKKFSDAARTIGLDLNETVNHVKQRSGNEDLWAALSARRFSENQIRSIMASSTSTVFAMDEDLPSCLTHAFNDPIKKCALILTSTKDDEDPSLIVEKLTLARQALSDITSNYPRLIRNGISGDHSVLQALHSYKSITERINTLLDAIADEHNTQRPKSQKPSMEGMEHISELPHNLFRDL